MVHYISGFLCLLYMCLFSGRFSVALGLCWLAHPSECLGDLFFYYFDIFFAKGEVWHSVLCKQHFHQYWLFETFLLFSLALGHLQKWGVFKKNKTPLGLNFGALPRLKLPAYIKICGLLAAFLTSKQYKEHKTKIWSILWYLRITFCKSVERNSIHHKNVSNMNITFYLNHLVKQEIVMFVAQLEIVDFQCSSLVQDFLWWWLRVLQIWV